MFLHTGLDCIALPRLCGWSQWMKAHSDAPRPLTPRGPAASRPDQLLPGPHRRCQMPRHYVVVVVTWRDEYKNLGAFRKLPTSGEIFFGISCVSWWLATLGRSSGWTRYAGWLRWSGAGDPGCCCPTAEARSADSTRRASEEMEWRRPRSPIVLNSSESVPSTWILAGGRSKHGEMSLLSLARISTISHAVGR